MKSDDQFDRVWAWLFPIVCVLSILTSIAILAGLVAGVVWLSEHM